MGKSIVRKKSIDIKGILNIGDEENDKNIYIECEDLDEPLLLMVVLLLRMVGLYVKDRL